MEELLVSLILYTHCAISKGYRNLNPPRILIIIYFFVNQTLGHAFTTASWYIKYFLIFNFISLPAQFLLSSCLISFRMHSNVSFTYLFSKAVCLETSWPVVFFTINQNWRRIYFCFAFRLRKFDTGDYVTKWFSKMFFQIPYDKKKWHKSR